MTLDEIRYYGGRYPLDDWDLIRVNGEDRERFLQGQLSNDIKKLELDHSHLTTRLNRVGQLQAFFYLAKKSNCLYFLIPKRLTESLLEDLNKFIIMDDVEMEVVEKKTILYLGHEAWNIVDDESFRISFNGELGIVSFIKREDLELPEILNESMEELRKLHGTPAWDDEVKAGMLVNESTLNQYAVSYDKGCFLGQEPAAKIQSNRGAARYPVLVELKTGELIKVSLKREQRVEGKKVFLEDGRGEGVVHYLPYFKAESFADKAVELYEKAVELFQKEAEEDAIIYLKRAVELAPDFADAYESLGVIYGRQEKFEQGIGLMDKLLEVDPDSVMAHTNKSLYFMRLGKIEEAEEEKGLATVKSFAKFGEEAKMKKATEEMKRQQEEELRQREGMFLQVLEIDSEDTIANFGMGDISFHRKEFPKAVEFLSKVLEIDSNYSMAYSLLGKSYEGLGQNEKAKSVYKKGIEIASKRGDLMPANEMQARLAKL